MARIFYRPTHPETGEMWDTWLYWHAGVYYLYYLARSGEQWDNIALATSPDGVHWNETGTILRKGADVTWMGTGSTWQSPNFASDGKFQLNFSEWKGSRQTIFFAESSDLVHWQRLGENCEFCQDDRWYQPLGRWDCIWTLPQPAGGFYGYWTASPRAETSGRFGFGQSMDGVHWEALPPPIVDGAGEGEVGAVVWLGEKVCMMFGSYPTMITLFADQPQGPFRAADKNRTLLNGYTYFSRFFPSPGGLLVNHHSIARDGHIYMGLLKQAVIDAEGVLRLGWWKGNEALKEDRGLQVISPMIEENQPVSMLPQMGKADGGVILEASFTLPPHAFAAPRGLYLACEGDYDAVLLLDSGGRVQFGLVHAEGSTSRIELNTDRQMVFGNPARLRLVLENSLAELYLDDILIECYSLPALATGAIGLVHGGDRLAFGDLTIWR